MMNKDVIKAALMRAWHAVWQTLAATLPPTYVITPAMIQQFDTKVIFVILAWLGTGLVAGGLSFIKSIAAGMPETQLADTLYALDNREGELNDKNFMDEVDVHALIHDKEEHDAVGE